MPFDPGRAIADLARGRRAHRRPRHRRRPPRLLDRRVDQGARLRPGPARRPPAPRSTATRPATSGRTCAAPATGCVIVGSHVDSVPNGGWLDGVLGIAGALEVLREHRRGRDAAVHRRVRRLRGRGGRAVRAQPVRLLRRLRPSGAGGARRPSRPRGQAARGRAARVRRRARGGAEGGQPPRRRARLPRAAHRAGPGAGVRGPRRGHGARHGRCRAVPRALLGPGRARRLDADPPAPRLVPGRRPDGARAARDRAPPRRRLHRRRRHLRARRRHGRPRQDRDAGRPAPPRRRHSGRHEGRLRRGGRAVRAGGGLHRRDRADLADRADPVRPRPDRHRPRRRQGGHGHRPRASRPARSTTPPRWRAPACRR